MKSYATLAALAATALGVTGGATAATTTDPDVLSIQSESVHYDAAQINDDRSARHLFFRIRKAAEDVCSISSFPRGYEIWYEHDCAASAVNQAVRDASLPALDEYYFDITGNTVEMSR